MNLLPYEHFTIQTHLSAEEVNRRLADSVEPRKMVRWFSFNHKPYEGDVSSDSFNIRRIIHYRNSFLPQITGSIRSDLGRTLIEIRMGLHPFVVLFTIVWVGVFGSIVLSTVVRQVVDAGSISSAVLYVSPIVLLMIAVFIGAFKFESSKSKRFFRELLEDIGAG